MKFTLSMQLLGFAIYGLIIGNAFSYRIAHERQFFLEVLSVADVKTLSEIKL